MAAAETARLIASLELQDKGFGAGTQKAITQTGKLETALGRIGTRASQGLKTAAGNIAKLGLIGAGAIAAIGAASVKAGLKSLSDLERLTKQTEAVIESTGGKAGVSAKQVGEYAESLEDLTTVDDKVIRDGENLLLTFTNIGQGVFPDATKAMVNLGVAMAGGDASAVDLQGTAIQLGKALNDPIKGVTALSRVGVSFTQQQKDQIAAMVKAGDVAGAQKIILQELETEFGKAGEAAGTGYAADMRRLDDAVEGAQQALAIGFLPIIRTVSQFLREKLSDPKVLSAIQDLGTKGAGLLEQAFNAAKSIPWQTIGDTFKFMGQGAKAAFDLFTGLPPWVQTAVLTSWGLNKLTGGALGGIFSELAKGLIKGVLGINAGVVNINAATVNGAGGLGAGAGGAGLKGMLGNLAGSAVIGGTVTLALDQIGRLPQLLRGIQGSLDMQTPDDFRAVYKDIIEGSTLSSGFKPLIDAFNKFAGLDVFLNAPPSTPTPIGEKAAGGGLKSTTMVVPGPGFTEWRHEQATGDSQIVQNLRGMQASFSERWGDIAEELNQQGVWGRQRAQQVAERLGVTIGTLRDLRRSATRDMAHSLGITVGELRSIRRSSHHDDAVLAAKLGISVDELQALREKARLTASNTAKIVNKDWSPTINTTVKTSFTVSARTIANEVVRYRTNAGRQGAGVI